MKKDFETWNILKIQINDREVLGEDMQLLYAAKKGDMWWCHVGLNVGSEEDGKNAEFERPVVILSKISTFTYLVVPTTSKDRAIKHRVKVRTQDNKFSFALLDQIKIIDMRRLKRRIGTVLIDDYNSVLNELSKMILSNCETPLARGISEPFGTVSTV